jgi:hypothetical protein
MARENKTKSIYFSQNVKMAKNNNTITRGQTTPVRRLDAGTM